ncbi:MAG: ribosome small subunit-dependent GTPase A, partial [Bifidobacteriaceae bacterium]|jgi:ribosome biogenesis GTPase|nr:ribosome small subunit-dependent GTPase A [Bifidobacteriaceae bacterium]
MIDRQLVAAYDAGMDAVICLTKRDLGTDARLRELYEPLGVAIATTGGPGEGGGPGDGGGGPGDGGNGPGDGGNGPAGGGGGRTDGIGRRLTGLERVAELLAGRTSVLVGHSGVGKSTLINQLVPGAGRTTGAVNLVTGKGRHTSSSAVALELPGGGWVIDTPGVRSFGLGHVKPDRVMAAFPDLAAQAAGCPRTCPHGLQAPGCALAEWAADSSGRQARLESYLRILATCEGR